MATPGATKPGQPITEEVVSLAKQVKSAVEIKVGRTFDVYNPVSFASQVNCS